MMDEKQKAIEFTLRLDEMLQTGSLPDPQTTGFAHLLDTAHKLSTADFSSQSGIRQSLYTRLFNSAQPKLQRSLTTAQRKLAVFAFSILILFAVSFTFPPIRTLAQEIIKRLQTITLTNAPSIVESYLTATPTIDPQNPPSVLTQLTLQEAVQRAGFTPLTPTYLPLHYKLSGYTAVEGQITSDFQPQNQPLGQCCEVLSLIQVRSTTDRGEFPVGNTQIEDVTVRGLPALWVRDSQTGMTPDKNGVLQIMPVNVLTWEENGYLFWMSSYSALTNQPLNLSEMMRVANALQLPQK